MIRARLLVGAVFIMTRFPRCLKDRHSWVECVVPHYRSGHSAAAERRGAPEAHSRLVDGGAERRGGGHKTVRETHRWRRGELMVELADKRL